MSCIRNVHGKLSTWVWYLGPHVPSNLQMRKQPGTEKEAIEKRSGVLLCVNLGNMLNISDLWTPSLTYEGARWALPVRSMGALVYKRLACDTAGVTGQQGPGTRSPDSTALSSPIPPMQVENISLQEGETITVEGLGGPDPLPLANQSFLMRGQVIRSPTHQAALRFQSLPLPGTFHFRYQGKA